jgi:V/A-type H+-transporting ATPase subunit D
LLRLKRDLTFAQEGYDLLEQKRQVLVVELMALIDDTIEAQEKMAQELQRAFYALQKAVLTMGKNEVKSLANAVQIQSDVNIHMLKVMGVAVPKVDVRITDTAPYYSPGATSFWADETIQRFKQVLTDMGRLAELRVSLLRLAQEVRKTVRRTNALEKIAIPDYKDSIKFIEDSLEESERGTFAMLKLVKERLEKKKG